MAENSTAAAIAGNTDQPDADFDARVEAKVAERLKAAQENKSSELDRIKDETLKQAAAKAKHDEEVAKEAEYLAYINNIKSDEIKDPVAKTVIEKVMSSSGMSLKEKKETMEKVLCEANVRDIMTKIEQLSVVDAQGVNATCLGLLKTIRTKGDNLSESEIARANDAMQALSYDLDRIGKQQVAAGLASEADLKTMGPLERHQYEAKNLASVVRKDRDEKLMKIRERRGVF